MTFVQCCTSFVRVVLSHHPNAGTHSTGGCDGGYMWAKVVVVMAAASVENWGTEMAMVRMAAVAVRVAAVRTNSNYETTNQIHRQTRKL